MSMLSNIFPTGNADSFNGGAAMTVSGMPEKAGVPFDHWMTRGLPPSSNESEKSGVEMDTDNSPHETKNLKFSTQTPNKNPLKRADDGSKVAVNPSLSFETKSVATDLENVLAQMFAPVVTDQKPGANNPAAAADNPYVATIPAVEPQASLAAIHLENISVPIFAPAIVMPDKKNELGAKTDVPVTDLKAATLTKPGKISSLLSEAKNISAADTKMFGLPVSKTQPGVEPNPKVETVNQEKIMAAVGKLAVDQRSPTDLKVASLTATNPQVPLLNKDTNGDLKPPKAAIEIFVQSSPPEFSASPDLNPKAVTKKESEVNGTPVAQQDVPMTKTENKDKITSSAGKILPGSAVSVAREKNLPARENFSALAMRAGQVTATFTANSPDHVAEVAPASADSVNSIASANVSDVRSRALERVQDMVVLHATRLSDVGNDSLQVVIKPGAGTLLSLELRQRGDGVEATATLQHGDFGHLNQQWPALQQQLEQRGIRLAPLVTDGNFVNSGENNFQQKQNQSTEPDSFSAGAFVEIAPAGLMTGSFAQVAERAGAQHGWESWA